MRKGQGLSVQGRTPKPGGSSSLQAEGLREEQGYLPWVLWREGGKDPQATCTVLLGPPSGTPGCSTVVSSHGHASKLKSCGPCRQRPSDDKKLL